MDVLRGRWAPTPSGFLHAGNARSALLAWLSVRARGGEFLWRLEDLDPPRVLKGAAEQALDDLEWLGLDWDAGGGLPGPAAPYEQSARSEHYEAALQRLADLGRLFPCELSRKELRDIARAPHGPSGAAYPPHLRPKDLDPAWYRSFLATPGRDAGKPPAALRFLVDEGITRFNDGVYGPQAQDVAAAV
ncbi:MAG: glutamate--tRNA ligase family protein, partial [Acidobacteriota bacterium]